MKNIKKDIFPDIRMFKELSKKGNIIPVYKEIIADLETPVSTFLKLSKNEPYCYLLESVEGGERWGRYSFISWGPKKIFESKDKKYSFYNPRGKKNFISCADPIYELKDLMSEFKPQEVEGLPRFWGGAVGYFSYDIVRFIERLENKPIDELKLPDSLFMLTDKIVIFDHLTHTVKVAVCVDLRNEKNVDKSYKNAAGEIEKIIKLLSKPLKEEIVSKHSHYPIESNMSITSFKEKIVKIKKYIVSGDIIQAVFSQRFSRKTKAKPFNIYRALRLINPSPYMYYIKLKDFEIVGSSPEILVRKEGDLAETRPIAGTRPRADCVEDDNRNAKELLCDPKERAEHIMLVDLGRNDLGRVCVPKSVKVPQLMAIEKYSHVMHIVSSVIGKLKAGTDAFDLLRACFPAGTVSGAPKVRAMEIIDELEPAARGPYAGALGYFSYSGNMDMAITIRTIVIKDSKAYGQAGAGIVADSVPESEYKESKNKAAALFDAIRMAEKGFE